MPLDEALPRAFARAGQLRVDPQLTVLEAYEAELLGRLQARLRGGLVWKGGTALRLEGSERFSRDLDATRRSAALSPARLQHILRQAGHGLLHLTGAETNLQPQSIVAAYRFRIPGLRQPLTIRVEVSLREKVLEEPAPVSTARLAHPAGLVPVVVSRLAWNELLAEKIRALVMRRAGRDVYDVYWLLERRTEFSPRLFLRKMAYYNRIGRPADPVAALEKAVQRLDAYPAARARTELANLLPGTQQNLDFAVIIEDVARALNSWLPLVQTAT